MDERIFTPGRMGCFDYAEWEDVAESSVKKEEKSPLFR
jgi:hypothetical protein